MAKGFIHIIRKGRLARHQHAAMFANVAIVMAAPEFGVVFDIDGTGDRGAFGLNNFGPIGIAQRC